MSSASGVHAAALTHSGHSVVAEDGEEANNFTNAVAAIPTAQDGRWDFG